MNIFSIFVLLSIFAGVCYAADFLVKDSDAIPVQGSINPDGSDITLTEVKTPAAATPNDVEPILPITLTQDDAIIDDEDDELDDDDERAMESVNKSFFEQAFEWLSGGVTSNSNNSKGAKIMRAFLA